MQYLKEKIYYKYFIYKYRKHNKKIVYDSYYITTTKTIKQKRK